MSNVSRYIQAVVFFCDRRPNEYDLSVRRRRLSGVLSKNVQNVSTTNKSELKQQNLLFQNYQYSRSCLAVIGKSNHEEPTNCGTKAADVSTNIMRIH